MSERSWPDLPIGRIELTVSDRNEMREIGPAHEPVWSKNWIELM